jgi:hypothetical protein
MAYEDAKTGQARALRARMTLAKRRLWFRVRYPNWAVLSDVDGVLEHRLSFCRGHLPETE